MDELVIAAAAKNELMMSKADSRPVSQNGVGTQPKTGHVASPEPLKQQQKQQQQPGSQPPKGSPSPKKGKGWKQGKSPSRRVPAALNPVKHHQAIQASGTSSPAVLSPFQAASHQSHISGAAPGLDEALVAINSLRIENKCFARIFFELSEGTGGKNCTEDALQASALAGSEALWDRLTQQQSSSTWEDNRVVINANDDIKQLTAINDSFCEVLQNFVQWGRGVAAPKAMLRAIALAGPDSLRALISSGAAALDTPEVQQWIAANPGQGFDMTSAGTYSSSLFTAAAAAPCNTQSA